MEGVATPGNFSTFDFDKLDDFWEFASPIGPLFGASVNKFVFRGQRDSDWKLVPQAYRQDIIEDYKEVVFHARKDHPGQTMFEWALLNSFVRHCDLRGLAVPADSMEFREYFSLDNIMLMNGRSNESWPQDRVLPLMAMAQHHGVPTRLLDWSTNPMVASYFAAAGAVNGNATSSDRKIAVFGFAINSPARDAQYRYVRVPGSTSVNLSAQGGSFLLLNNFGNRGEDFTVGVSLESKLAPNDKLIKMTLPITLAGELLERCNRFGISAASIFPGYDGVAKAVLEGLRMHSFLGRFI